MSNDGDDIRALLLKSKKARGDALRLNDQRAANALNTLADELDGQASALREERKPATVPAIPQQAVDAPQGEPHIGPELIAAMKQPAAADEQQDAETEEGQ